MKNCLLFTIFMFAFVEVQAGHIGQVTLKRIRVMDTVALVMTNEPISAAASSCSTVNNHFVVPLDETHSSNRKLAVLLSAHAAKKIVNPHCDNSCYTGFPWLGDVTMCYEVSIE